MTIGRLSGFGERRPVFKHRNGYIIGGDKGDYTQVRPTVQVAIVKKVYVGV